jgi:hypothetical protein
VEKSAQYQWYNKTVGRTKPKGIYDNRKFNIETSGQKAKTGARIFLKACEKGTNDNIL